MSKTSNSNDRPRIWSEGAQHPPFQPRAFALASMLFARDSLSGLLMRCGTSADDFGQQVATGRWTVPPQRLGRTGRYLPSTATTAATIRGAADVLRRAARVARPDDEANRLPPSIFDARPEPVAPKPAAAEPAPQMAPRMAPAAPRTTDEDPELAAIRALIDAAADAPRRPARPQRATAEPAAPQVQEPAVAPAATGWRREWLANLAATGLGYGLLVMAVPVGVARAGFAHLNGEDLRQMVDEA